MANEHIKTRLMGKYLPETTGTWQILGEDPNLDLGGRHVQPDLGTVTGRYVDIIEYALSLPQFIDWGAGGEIVKVNEKLKAIPVGFTSESLKSLYDRKALLQKELESIEEKISNLDIDYE